jgi:hypothetical protein
MKTAICLAIAASFAGAGAASAESFVSTSKAEPATAIDVPAVGGQPALRGAHWKGVLTATFKSGRVDKADFSCIGWMTPGAAIAQRAVCDSANGPDKFSMRVDCLAPDQASRTQFCQGVLVGTGGRWAGKTGLFSQIGRQGGEATAQGAWND